MDALQGLPSEVLHRLSRELAGEKLLWAGRPDPRAMLFKSLPILLFAVPWTAFALAWETLALSAFFNTGVGKVSGPGGIMSYIFPLFGLPFVLIGLGMLAVPFWAFHRARHTVHALTDARLVSAGRPFRDLEIKTILPEAVYEITRQIKPNGTATMTFSLGQHRDSDGDLVEKKEIWYGVPDGGTLEARLRALMAARKPAA